jgi:hypothetical protein
MIEEIIKKQYYLFNNDSKYLEFVVVNNLMVYTKLNDNNFTQINNNIKLDEITWVYNNQNIRTPYYKQNILIIKLNSDGDFDNIFDYISSNKLIPYEEIIYGERIQSLADIIVGEPRSLSFNPNNPYFSKSMATIDNLNLSTIDNLNLLNKYKSIFVFTHDLEKFYSKFGQEMDDKILITHNSDEPVNKEYNCKLHLAQNCFLDNKIIGIPIGIENNQWFNHDLFKNVINMKIEKTNLIYFNFSLSTHVSRIDCYNKLKDILKQNSKKPKEEYFKDLASHRFAVCPRGNGLDTHRLWECYYLDVIPIIIKDDFINIPNLPMIILNDWSELNISKLNNLTFNNLKNSKITISYYKNII